MTRTVDELYDRIGQEVVDAIDDDWEKARIEFEFYGTAGSATGRYWPADGEERDFGVSYDVYEAFKKLHEVMSDGDSVPWNYAVFRLSPSGEFTIDFDFDDDIAEKYEQY